MPKTIAQLARSSIEKHHKVVSQFPAESWKDIMADLHDFADEWDGFHYANITDVYGRKDGNRFRLRIEWTDQKRED